MSSASLWGYGRKGHLPGPRIQACPAATALGRSSFAFSPVSLKTSSLLAVVCRARSYRGGRGSGIGREAKSREECLVYPTTPVDVLFSSFLSFIKSAFAEQLQNILQCYTIIRAYRDDRHSTGEHSLNREMGTNPRTFDKDNPGNKANWKHRLGVIPSGESEKA